MSKYTLIVGTLFITNSTIVDCNLLKPSDRKVSFRKPQKPPNETLNHLMNKLFSICSDQIHFEPLKFTEI